MIRNHLDLFKNHRYMLNEGGLGTDSVAIEGATVFNIQFAGKGILWLKAKAEGNSGHGSSPPPEYAASNLVNFLTELQAMPEKVQITSQTEPFFYQLGEASGFLNSFFLHRAGNPLVKKLIAGVILGNRHLNAMTSNTISITGLNNNVGTGTNVIGARAEATLDIRLLPGVKPADFSEKVKAVAARYHISIEEIDSFASESSTIETPFFNALAGVTQANYPKATIAPLLSPGFTDSIHFRKAGLVCYGFIPVVVTAKDLDGFHGKDERISLANLKSGIKIIYESTAAMNQ